MATMVSGLTLVSIYSSSFVFSALVVRRKGRGLGILTGTIEQSHSCRRGRVKGFILSPV